MAGEPIHLIYIGSLLHVRNLFPLCQAVERSNIEGMKFRLSLVGDGEARHDLENFALHTDGRIRVWQPVSHDQVPKILGQAHVGVTSPFYPNREIFQASSPIKLFEYMAAGLPILATRMACISDVVKNGDYTFWVGQADVVEFLEALCIIWKSQSTLSKMGAKAADAASFWTWRKSAMALRTALEYGLAKSQVGSSP
jgi:glycosyltransferase involved in cell wall biosynthesis